MNSLMIQIYTFERKQKDGKVMLHLKVNFNPESISLHKEVRHLKNMGFRVPLKIVNAAHQTSLVYSWVYFVIVKVER